MRILHVIRSADPAGGGPIEVVRQFAGAHLEQGHKVEILTLDTPEASYLGGLPGIVHGIGTCSKGYGYTSTLVPWLCNRRNQFDAALIHGLWQFHGRGTYLALRGTGTPYYVYPHGMLDPWFRTAYPLKHVKKVVYWHLVESRVLRDARAVLFTCEEERRLARQTFYRYRCIERIAPLGILTPPSFPDRQRKVFMDHYPDLKGKRLFMFLGRLHQKKGCDILIRAFGELYRNGILGDEHKLVLAGPCAEPAYLNRLKRLASESCPPDAVCFPGMLSGDIKWGALRSAEVFVLPSHQENFGIAVVEALSCSVPVLISKKVNIWREIEQDAAGLVAPDTIEDTYRMLAKWQEYTPEYRASMRVNAQRSFRMRFEISEAARRLIQTLKEPRR